MTPYDKMIEPEQTEGKNPLDTKRPMSNNDKILTAGWFRRISDAILSHTYPDDWADHVKGVVTRCKTIAGDLETEVYKDRVQGW